MININHVDTSGEVVFMENNSESPIIPGIFYQKISEEFPRVLKRKDLSYQVKSLTNDKQRVLLDNNLAVFETQNQDKAIMIGEAIFSFSHRVFSSSENFITDFTYYFQEAFLNILDKEPKIRHCQTRKVFEIYLDDFEEIKKFKHLSLITPESLNKNERNSLSFNSEFLIDFDSILGVNGMSVFAETEGQVKIIFDSTVVMNIPEKIKTEDFPLWLKNSVEHIDEVSSYLLTYNE